MLVHTGTSSSFQNSASSFEMQQQSQPMEGCFGWHNKIVTKISGCIHRYEIMMILPEDPLWKKVVKFVFALPMILICAFWSLISSKKTADIPIPSAPTVKQDPVPPPVPQTAQPLSSKQRPPPRVLLQPTSSPPPPPLPIAPRSFYLGSHPSHAHRDVSVPHHGDTQRSQISALKQEPPVHRQGSSRKMQRLSRHYKGSLSALSLSSLGSQHDQAQSSPPAPPSPPPSPSTPACPVAAAPLSPLSQSIERVRQRLCKGMASFPLDQLEQGAYIREVQAQYERGRKSASNGLFKDAFDLIQQAAQGGHPLAQSDLGSLYVGYSLHPSQVSWTKKHLQSFHWLKLAANKGVADAQYFAARVLLGDDEYRGKGIRSNTEQGMHYMEQAAKQGHPDAAYWLGSWYSQAIVGMEINYTEAAKYFEMAYNSFKACQLQNRPFYVPVGYGYDQATAYDEWQRCLKLQPLNLSQ